MSSTAPHHEHKSHAPSSIGCVVITCSDTRTTETDTSGYLIMQCSRRPGIRSSPIISSKTNQRKSKPRFEAPWRTEVQAIIINGGTGISKRDSTFEAVDAMLEKRLVGFGEIFRYLTYQDIGSPAIMSRATAGIIKGRVLFSTPGSENAVRLAMEKLILPELGHLVKELTSKRET